VKHGILSQVGLALRAGRGAQVTARPTMLGLIFLSSIFLSTAATPLPPLPPGYKPAMRSPRQLTTTVDRSMSRSVIAPPATNAPAMLVIRGWDTFAGERVPRLALRFGTNAPHATIFTRTYGTDWRCFTTLDGISNGSVRDFGWCPTPGSAGDAAQLFKVVLHD